MARISGWLLFIALLSCGLAAPALSQTGGGHTVFGDFKVDESRVGGPERQIFNIILYNAFGRVVGRQAVSSGGRYSFAGVRNGEYDIVVELGNEEVTRLHLVLTFTLQTDVRQDVALEWRKQPSTRPDGGKAGVVSVLDVYSRTDAQEAYFAKAREATKKKDYEQAGSILRQIVKDTPKDFEAWTELGTLQFKQGHAAEAEKHFLRALEERPSFIVALLNLGKLRFERKNYDGAIEVLTRAVSEQPQSAEANYFLGETYLQIKKGSKAVGYLYEAIRLDPAGMADAHLRLAALYNAAGMKDKAALEYERFLAKKPDHAEKKMLQQYITENRKP